MVKKPNTTVVKKPSQDSGNKTLVDQHPGYEDDNADLESNLNVVRTDRYDVRRESFCDGNGLQREERKDDYVYRG